MVSLTQARSILGAIAQNLTDSEVQEFVDNLYAVVTNLVYEDESTNILSSLVREASE